MSATLRFNDALLITGSAFQPLQCVAWAAQENHDELNISLLDSDNTLLGRTRLSSHTYRDPQQLEQEIRKSREELSQRGVLLAPWSMPA